MRSAGNTVVTLWMEGQSRAINRFFSSQTQPFRDRVLHVVTPHLFPQTPACRPALSGQQHQKKLSKADRTAARLSAHQLLAGHLRRRSLLRLRSRKSKERRRRTRQGPRKTRLGRLALLRLEQQEPGLFVLRKHADTMYTGAKQRGYMARGAIGCLLAAI